MNNPDTTPDIQMDGSALYREETFTDNRIGTIRKMAREEGMALVLVEQHAEVALGLTDQAVVIERGVVAHAAASQALLQDQATLDRYVGLNLADH